MGLMITKLAKRIAALMDTMQDARILLVGLDGAGKTTLLYKFKIGEAGLPTSFPHFYFKHARSCLPVIIICAKAKLLVSSFRIIHVLIRVSDTRSAYSQNRGIAVATIPTIGFNTEEVQYKNIRFSMWDVGGQVLYFHVQVPLVLPLLHLLY